MCVGCVSYEKSSKATGKIPAYLEKPLRFYGQRGFHPEIISVKRRRFFRGSRSNIYYLNEPGERLQAPLATLRMGYGDCDDMVILLCSFFEAARLPWKFALAGKGKDGKLKRYIEGEKLPPGVEWSHVYCIVGNDPFTPTSWLSAEPTLKVPLGWDVTTVDGAISTLRTGRNSIWKRGGWMDRSDSWSFQKRVG